jgi:hypothetical protein
VRSPDSRWRLSRAALGVSVGRWIEPDGSRRALSPTEAAARCREGDEQASGDAAPPWMSSVSPAARWAHDGVAVVRSQRRTPQLALALFLLSSTPASKPSVMPKIPWPTHQLQCGVEL